MEHEHETVGQTKSCWHHAPTLPSSESSTRLSLSPSQKSRATGGSSPPCAAAASPPKARAPPRAKEGWFALSKAGAARTLRSAGEENRKRREAAIFKTIEQFRVSGSCPPSGTAPVALSSPQDDDLILSRCPRQDGPGGVHRRVRELSPDYEVMINDDPSSAHRAMLQ